MTELGYEKKTFWWKKKTIRTMKMNEAFSFNHFSSFFPLFYFFVLNWIVGTTFLLDAFSTSSNFEETQAATIKGLSLLIHVTLIFLSSFPGEQFTIIGRIGKCFPSSLVFIVASNDVKLFKGNFFSSFSFFFLVLDVTQKSYIHFISRFCIVSHRHRHKHQQQCDLMWRLSDDNSLLVVKSSLLTLNCWWLRMNDGVRRN